MTTAGATRPLRYAIGAAVTFLVAVAGTVYLVVVTRPSETIWIVVVAFALLGSLVLWRRPGNATGWVFAGMGISGVGSGVAPEDGFLSLFSGLGWFGFFFLTVAVLPMLFPTGTTLGPRWRWLLRGAFAVFAAFAVLWLLQERICEQWAVQGNACLSWSDNPIGISGVESPESSVVGGVLLAAMLFAAVVGLVSLGVRLRRARGVERQQLKWLLLALGSLVLFILVVDVVLTEALGLDIPGPVYRAVVGVIWLALPVSAAVAIFRYGLYEIDRIISRAVAYTIAVVVLTGAYVGVVVGVGALVEVWVPSGEDLGLPLPVVSTAIVAIAFQPVRVRAMRLANRLVYGRRASPYEAITGLNGSTLDEVLPQIARLATEATAARRAVVWLSNGLELRPVAAFPDEGALPSPVPLDGGEIPAVLDGGDTIPLTNQRETFGVVAVHLAAGETLAPDDRRLLTDLAAHAAVALRAVLEAVVLPEGIVTFLMTDIEGSTRLWEEDPDAMSRAIREHDLIVRRAVAGGGGLLIKWRGEGDSTFSVFTDAAGAVVAALDLQDELSRHRWPTSRPISVRAALHTGEAELRERDYFGKTVNRCARLRAIAVGGQTLVSSVTRELARDNLPDAVVLTDLGERPLKDLAEPEHVYQVAAADPGPR